MSPHGRQPAVSISRAVWRALRGACPACGLGRVFHARFRSEPRCDTCGWLFERGEGHWIGGSEINMIATFWTACPTFIVLNAVVGFSWISLVLAGAFTVTFSLLIYQPSRCLFIAFDYLVDPHYDPGEDGGNDPHDPPAPPPVAPFGSRAPEGGHRAQRD